MKKLGIVFTAIVICIIINVTMQSNTGGISGQAVAGCTCHGSVQNTSSIITFTGIPTTGYTPGTTYSCTVTILNTTKINAGFDLLMSSGTISNNSAGTAIVNNGLEIRHITPQTMVSNTATWSFDWTAPSTYITVTTNIAANACNNNALSSGDHWVKTALTFASIPVPPTPPTIVNFYPTVSTTNGYTAGLLGTVNPHSYSTSISMEYGLTTSYGSTFNSLYPAITSTNTVNAISPNLLPNTTYHCRLVATNIAGTTYSNDTTFKTITILLPTASVNAPTLIDTNTANITGNIYPSFDTIVTGAIEYGTTTAYGNIVSYPYYFSTNIVHSFYVSLVGLTPNTLYHYRCIAHNNVGYGYSADRTFKTLQSAVGIADVNKTPKQLYPNPVSTIATIPWAETLVHLTFTNFSGQIITVPHQIKNNNIELSVADLPAGYYQIQCLASNNQRYFYSFIKQ